MLRHSELAAFFDEAGAETLPQKFQQIFAEDDPLPTAEAPECFAVTMADHNTNLIAYRAGTGDGTYPVWIGRDASGRIVNVVADMLIADDAEPLPPATPSTARYLPITTTDHETPPPTKAAEVIRFAENLITQTQAPTTNEQDDDIRQLQELRRQLLERFTGDL